MDSGLNCMGSEGLVIKPGTERNEMERNETKRNGKDRQKCGLWLVWAWPASPNKWRVWGQLGSASVTMKRRGAGLMQPPS